VVVCLEEGADFLHIVQLMPHTRTRLTALFRDYLGKQYQNGKTNLDFTVQSISLPCQNPIISCVI